MDRQTDRQTGILTKLPYQYMYECGGAIKKLHYLHHTQLNETLYVNESSVRTVTKVQCNSKID